MKTEERPRTLDQVLPLLKMAYKDWKAAEGLKNSYKDEFFQLADAALRVRGLGLTMVQYPAPSEDIAVSRALLHNPGWLIDSYRPHRIEEGVWEFVLIEDPGLQPFSFEHDGYKFARTVSKGPVMIDDEWLMEEDLELFLKCCFELPWGQVVAKPIDTLDSETIGAISKYIYNGKPRVSLAAPRPVKEDE